MKNHLLLLLIYGLFGGFAYGQTNTSHGAGAGNAGTYNTSVGYYAGDKVTSYNNSFFGGYAGFNNTSGGNNFFGGVNAGYYNTTGSGNLFLGLSSGRGNIDGSYNVYLGYVAGFNNTGGLDNINIGSYSGYNSSGGKGNIAIGRSAGSNNRADYNTFVGYLAGHKNETGRSNLFMGNDAGFANVSGSYNVYLGPLAGHRETNGQRNVYIGYETGGDAGGESNVFVGSHAGYYNKANYNTFIGVNAGNLNNNGTRNLFMGFSAGRSSSTGSDNVYLGYHAGSNNITGTGNVFIGHQAGYYEAGAGKFYLANSVSNTLLYGDFASRNLTVGGAVSSSYKLYVLGDAYATGVWLSSDKKWKQDERKIEKALDLINKFEPKSYEFKQTQQTEKMNFSPGKHYGFIAQDLQKVMPELVRKDEDGSLAINYIEIIPLLTEAIKELDKKQTQVNTYEDKLEQLEQEMQEMREQLATLASNRQAESAVDIKGVSETIENQKMIISPNPTSGELKITYQTNHKATDVQLRVFDMQGKWQKTINKLKAGKTDVKTHLNLPAGMYHIALIEDGVVTDTSRLVVE